MKHSRWLPWIVGAGILAVAICALDAWSPPFSVFTWARSVSVAEPETPVQQWTSFQPASKNTTVATAEHARTTNRWSAIGPQIVQSDPAEVLRTVAQTILDGPPLVADFWGQANLEVALRPLKSVRGPSSIVPMSGTFSSLGRGTGLARWQVNVGTPTAATINLVSQQQEMLAYSSIPGAVPGLVSVQPEWFESLTPASDSHTAATSLYGSPVSLVQWLPHHVECFWGELAELSMPAQRLTIEPDEQESRSVRQRVVLIGTVRSSVAARFGIVVPSAPGPASAGAGLDSVDWQVFAGWARQVPVPLPHVVEIRLLSELDGAVRLERVSFFRVHPLRPELEEMVGLQWGPWRLASELTSGDIMVGKP